MANETNNQAYHLVAVKFAGEDRAKQVVDLIKGQQKAADFKVMAWAVIEVNGKGKAKISQSGHGGAGAAVGAGTGVLLGLLGGPVGLIAWTIGGALVGGLAGKHTGNQFDKDQLEAIGASMEPNTSAIAVVIEDTLAEQFEDEMGIHDGQLLTVTLGDQLSGEVASFTAVGLGEEDAAAE
jgi:uncharacterized membrane protein